MELFDAVILGVMDGVLVNVIVGTGVAISTQLMSFVYAAMFANPATGIGNVTLILFLSKNVVC